MRFGRSLKQRIGNLVRFAHVSDFFLGFHERRKPLKLIKLTTNKDSDRPPIVWCPKILDVFQRAAFRQVH
jgi:hypothetical protein